MEVYVGPLAQPVLLPRLETRSQSKMQNTFREKTVIVTGASSGIGEALALRLADEGAWLALAARNAQRLDSLAGECQQRGSRAIAIPTDVADESQCSAPSVLI